MMWITQHAISTCRKSFIFTLVAALMLVCAAGCTHETSAHYHHGQAARALLAAQVANPDAPTDPSPPRGMRGVVSEGIFLNRYVNEFVAEQDDDDDDSNE